MIANDLRGRRDPNSGAKDWGAAGIGGVLSARGGRRNAGAPPGFPNDKSDHALVNSVLAFEHERVIILAVRPGGVLVSSAPTFSAFTNIPRETTTMTTDLMRKVLVAGAAVAALSVAACSKPADKPADASAAPAADAAAPAAATAAAPAAADAAAPAAAAAAAPAAAAAAAPGGAMAPADAKK